MENKTHHKSGSDKLFRILINILHMSCFLMIVDLIRIHFSLIIITQYLKNGGAPIFICL